jgi:hypothetical protein
MTCKPFSIVKIRKSKPENLRQTLVKPTIVRITTSDETQGIIVRGRFVVFQNQNEQSAIDALEICLR